MSPWTRAGPGSLVGLPGPCLLWFLLLLLLLLLHVLSKALSFCCLTGLLSCRTSSVVAVLRKLLASSCFGAAFGGIPQAFPQTCPMIGRND